MTPYQIHVAKWGDCERCPLYKRRSHVCHVRGVLPADVLFVGEAPGPSEDVLGKPFVGPAGKLLDKIINSCLPGHTEIGEDGSTEHWVREVRIAFTNLVGCIPLDDGNDKFVEPPEESIKKCSPKLAELVTMANPKIIICVGKLATKWVRKSPSSLVTHRKVVDIQHPASILRAGPESRGLLIQKCRVTLADAVAGI